VLDYTVGDAGGGYPYQGDQVQLPASLEQHAIDDSGLYSCGLWSNCLQEVKDEAKSLGLWVTNHDGNFYFSDRHDGHKTTVATDSFRPALEGLTSIPIVGDVADFGWCAWDGIASIFGGSKTDAGFSCGAAAIPGATAGGGAIVRRLGDDVLDAGEELIDLASAQRRSHILDGDATGGGHRWPGLPGKTPFPQHWTDDQIMGRVSDIATDPNADWVWPQGVAPGTDFGKKPPYRPHRVQVFGERAGVCIRVVVEPAGEGIITARPDPGRC